MQIVRKNGHNCGFFRGHEPCISANDALPAPGMQRGPPSAIRAGASSAPLRLNRLRLTQSVSKELLEREEENGQGKGSSRRR